MKSIRVIKLNYKRRETWRYEGRVLERGPEGIVLEAFFNRDDLPFHGLTMGQGDRFVEAYFSRRWYNIFEMHDREDDHLKGWYCNVTLPAEISEEQVAYVDLALDLLVFPEGKKMVLDEDEFEALVLDEETRRLALAALEELRGMAERGELSRFNVGK